jgi:hypothetical protein
MGAMYNIRLIEIVTTNPPSYDEYKLIKKLQQKYKLSIINPTLPHLYFFIFNF